MSRGKTVSRGPGYSRSAETEETGTPCSRKPPELCDGARLVVQADGTTRREPARTPRAFCTPCRDRIITSVRELASAYVRLQDEIGSPVKRTDHAVRVPFGPSVLIRADIDAQMRSMSAVLSGWAARVRSVPGLELSAPEHLPDTPEGVAEACHVLATHPDPLLSLQKGRTLRTYTFPPAAEEPPESSCRHCGLRITPGSAEERRDVRGRTRWWLAGKVAGPVAACAHEPACPQAAGKPGVIPADLLELIGDREIVRQGDGWLTVVDELNGAEAGNEILKMHWDSRRILGETKAKPETFDGVPCRSCETMTLERAEPPSDPSLSANHSCCPNCGDEMDRETFDQWADTYASWAKGAIAVCKRCQLAEPKHAECSWAHCACTEGEHPRRRAVA